MNVFVSGAMGYVGSVLVPQLLQDGHEVIAYDIGWFGDGFLPQDDPSCKLIYGDIRDIPKLKESLKGADAVIHMACVSNDHSCQLDEALSTSINYDAFEPLVIAAKEAGVKRFIYCSSSSVYGVSDAPNVTEEHPLVPLTLYNKYKGMCEPLLFKHQSDDFTCVTIRPATVCGYGPRMRFDLTVNILTAHAVLNKCITVFGGEQKRPNLHIQDMARCYRILLTAENIAGQTFNVGAENLKVSDLALMVKELVWQKLGINASIKTEDSTDKRSYHIDSSKILNVLGFKPEFGVEQAIKDLCDKFAQGYWPDALTAPIYTNVRQLVEKGVDVQDSLAAYRKDRYAG